MSDQAWIVAANVQSQRIARQRNNALDDYYRLRNMYNSLHDFAAKIENERDHYKSLYEKHQKGEEVERDIAQKYRELFTDLKNKKKDLELQISKNSAFNHYASLIYRANSLKNDYEARVSHGESDTDKMNDLKKRIIQIDTELSDFDTKLRNKVGNQDVDHYLHYCMSKDNSKNPMRKVNGIY